MLTKHCNESARASTRGAVGAAPVDHDVLHRLLGGDLEAEREIFRQFLASVPGDAQRLGGALAAGDRKLAMQLAHRLKGACRMVGANGLADACERGERKLRETGSRDETLSSLAAETDHELARVLEHLQGWLSGTDRSGGAALQG